MAKPRKRKPLTPEQRELKRARDRRYREAHRAQINARARARLQAKKQQFGPTYSDVLHRAYWKVRGNWVSEAEFWAMVEDAKERGATNDQIIARLNKQYSMTSRYYSHDVGEDEEGMAYWGERDDILPEDAWYRYHGIFS